MPELLEFNSSSKFPTTCWTLIQLAESLNSKERIETLEELTRRYWRPIYQYIRRRGFDVESAADLTQDFLARFCQQGKFSEADCERGRFRSFLLKSVKNFSCDSWRLQNSKKRRPSGGWVRLEAAVLEEEFSFQQTSVVPELEFDRNWLHIILSRSMEQFRRNYAEKETPDVVAYLCARLMGESLSQNESDLPFGVSAATMRKKQQRARMPAASGAGIAITVGCVASNPIKILHAPVTFHCELRITLVDDS